MNYPDTIKEFGDRVRKLRQKAGMSQQELADEAGIEKKTLQKVELARMNPSLDIIASIANGLGITLKHLMDI